MFPGDKCQKWPYLDKIAFGSQVRGPKLHFIAKISTDNNYKHIFEQKIIEFNGIACTSAKNVSWGQNAKKVLSLKKRHLVHMLGA